MNSYFKMDNRIALERMKQLLCDISTKNEVLNKDNNELNIKVLSLIKLLKTKDNQLENNKKLLIKHILKIFFYKRYIKEKQKLRKFLNTFKNSINLNTNQKNTKNISKSIIFYTHENDIFLPPSKKYNYNDIGVGDYKINYRFYIRKAACLTLLKRRKYIINIDDRNNINGQNNECKINLIFKNIIPQNEVINMYIKSNRSNNSDNSKKDYDFSVFHLNIINNDNKIKIFDNNKLKSENISNDYSILSGRNESIRVLKEEYYREINNYNEILKIIELDNNNLKLEINKKENEIKNLEKKYKDNESKINIKIQEKKELEEKILNIKKENQNYKNKYNEYETKYNNLNKIIKNKKLEIKIDNLNKYSLNIFSTRIIKEETKIAIRKIIKAIDIIIYGNEKSKNNSFNNILSFNNGSFKILSKRKKRKFTKFSFSLNIIKNSEDNYFKNKQFIIKKKNHLKIIDVKEKDKIKDDKDLTYDIIEPLKYEIDENKYNMNYNIYQYKTFDVIDISNSFNINFIGNKNIIKNNFELMKIDKCSELNIKEENNQKDEIINRFKININDINKRNSYFKLIILELKFRLIFYIKRKYLFFINFQNLYYQNKISNSFEMFRSLLINIKMKSILKLIFKGFPKYFFLKYYFTKYKSISFYISLLSTKKELIKNIESNNKLNSQINIFQETFKKYEESNAKEKNEKDNIILKQKSLINNLNDELSQIKNNFKIIKKSAKDSAAEIISSSNENNKQRKIIEKLNEELKELQKNKLLYENKISNQQEIIKNLNDKIKKDQFEYEQNEQDVNNQIEKLKEQFNKYENTLEKLNIQNINLKKENEKLKINNENLKNNKDELIMVIQNSKNYEKENKVLMNENKEIKKNSEEINRQYINLKNDFDNLKILSEESKAELSKAMNEMESYSELLQTLEMKIKEAEILKINAENERDKAINDVREIRLRYINIMGEKYA